MSTFPPTLFYDKFKYYSSEEAEIFNNILCFNLGSMVLPSYVLIYMFIFLLNNNN